MRHNAPLAARLAEDVARVGAQGAYAFGHGGSALSALVVAAYMAHLDAEGLARSSLDAALVKAIVDRRRAARVALFSNDPAVRDVLAGSSTTRTRLGAMAPL